MNKTHKLHTSNTVESLVSLYGYSGTQVQFRSLAFWVIMYTCMRSKRYYFNVLFMRTQLQTATEQSIRKSTPNSAFDNSKWQQVHCRIVCIPIIIYAHRNGNTGQIFMDFRRNFNELIYVHFMAFPTELQLFPWFFFVVRIVFDYSRYAFWWAKIIDFKWFNLYFKATVLLSDTFLCRFWSKMLMKEMRQCAEN